MITASKGKAIVKDLLTTAATIKLLKGQLSVSPGKSGITKAFKDSVIANKPQILEYLRSLQHSGKCSLCGYEMIMDKHKGLIFMDCPNEHESSTFSEDWLPDDWQYLVR